MQRIYKCVYWLMFKFGITRDWWFTKQEIQDACILQEVISYTNYTHRNQNRQSNSEKKSVL